MGFRDKHILLDGYNLELAEGTGIKTYGLGVARALRALGARVSVLWSCRRHSLPLIQDALLHENNRRRASWLDYTGGLLRALTRWPAPARRHHPTGALIAHPAAGLEEELAGDSYVLPECYNLAIRLFRATGAALAVRVPDRVDVWHATYPLPLTVRGAPKVTTIHDLIPLKLPWATTDDKRYFHRTVRLALKQSDLVVTDSEWSKNDLVGLFGVAPERVSVLYPAAPPPAEEMPPELLEEELRPYQLRPKSYCLFVSAIQPRKNLGRLCQALARLDAKTPLVVVGSKAWLWEEEVRQAAPLIDRDQIKFLDYVPKAHLPALYAGALFFAFPSLYEGFGLPALEAMAHGCPVLASTASCLPEVCGDAALYADPYDVRDLADKIQALTRNEGLRARLAARGRTRVERYGPENHGRSLLEAYSRVLP